MSPHSTVHDASLVNDILAQRPYEFLQPSKEIYSSVLALSKSYLDPVAFEVSSLQAERQKEQRKSRKRKRKDREAEEEILRITSLTIDGFNAEQVWAQAKRISAAVQLEVQRLVDEQKQLQLAAEAQSNQELFAGASEDVSDVEEENAVEEDEAEDDYSEGVEDDIEDDEDEIDFDAAVDAYEDDDSSTSAQENTQSASLVEDKFGLNDGFFSIDDFNRRTEMLEQQDFRGEPDLEAASDEEDLDYEIDPMSIKDVHASQTNGKKSKDKDLDPLHQDSEDDDIDSEEDDEDEEGPTFGDMDLDAAEGASDEEGVEDDEADDSISKPVMYKDFFDAPARKSTGKRRDGHSSLQEKSFATNPSGPAQDYEADIQRAMSAVYKDIFSDEEEEEEEAEDADEPAAGTSRAANPAGENLSSHEKRKADILAQIRQLEAKLIAKRPWVLAGEAKASDRPQNALLEEDLDFERTGKPLPVVTKETSEEIEELIKRRILAGEFDEVRKRRPGEELNSSTRRGRLLDQDLDAPRQKGLAEVYEEEHLRKNDPAYVDKRTEKLKKEHAEIEAMWKDISHKLDSLASFRYRPKPADVTISVRSDAPAISLEDARPSGVNGDIGSMDQLAPQEIYMPGEVKEKGKVVTKGGTVIDQAELSREERKRRRRREKERAKKAGPQKEAARAQRDSKSNEQAQIVGDLAKGGVKVINRKGELRDVQGNDVKDGVQRSAGTFRL